jgi:V8-like Glu-specific endopeptidase
VQKAKSFYLALVLMGLTVGSGCGDGTVETSEMEIGEVISICGKTEDFVPINKYRGPVSFVHAREEAVGRLNRSCSGTYIGSIGSARNLFLTAGHCGKKGQSASVQFNYEANADGPIVTVKGVFIESKSSPDYALIQLNANPGVTPTPLGTSATSSLTIIQHPKAQLKVVAFGTLSGSASGSRIYYAGLDTLGGSSGSGILNKSGQLIGVHTNGGCSSSGGTNEGWTISGIRAASSIL